MKDPQDPRHKRREKVIKALFRWAFQPEMEIKNQLVAKIIKSQPKIDKLITKAAPEWPIEQINRIDLAVLRLAVYELAIIPKEPPKVIIDEAVELAKTYGGEKSPGFVNGVLGTIFKKVVKKKPASGGKKSSPRGDKDAKSS